MTSLRPALHRSSKLPSMGVSPFQILLLDLTISLVQEGGKKREAREVLEGGPKGFRSLVLALSNQDISTFFASSEQRKSLA